jgi:hypothetical protein
VQHVATEVAVALGAAVALLLALAAASLAAIAGLAQAMPSWAGALIVAAFWTVVALLLVRHDHPRRLLTRLRRETSDQALRSAEQARDEAEQQVKATAERLGKAVAREAAEHEVKAGVSAAEKLAGEAEHEVEDLLKELTVALLAPGKAGMSLLEKIVGRQPSEP